MNRAQLAEWQNMFSEAVTLAQDPYDEEETLKQREEEGKNKIPQIRMKLVLLKDAHIQGE